MKYHELHEPKVVTDVRLLDRPGDIFKLGDQHFVFMFMVNWDECRAYLVLSDAAGNIVDRNVHVRMRDRRGLGRALFTFNELCCLIDSEDYHIA